MRENGAENGDSHLFGERWRYTLTVPEKVAVPIFMVVLAVAGWTSIHAAHARCDLEPGPVRSVARVIDGETLALDDGSEVRLIGALAPRAMDVGAEAGQWQPETEAVQALSTLVLGKSVTLGFGGERTDRYGRALAHVFLDGGGDKAWVQGQMLSAGHARAYAISGNRACQSELLAHERVARDAGLGLWQHAAYQIRRAVPPWPLNAYRGTFQIVDGVVTRASEAREVSYLNFGDGRIDDTSRTPRRAFSINIKRADRDVLGEIGGAVKTLDGARLEVRGWIESKSGPSIDISMAGLIARSVARGDINTQQNARPD
jgi:micrococcal nuclease